MSSSIEVVKPKQFFRKNVKFNLKSMFSGLTKAVTHIGTGNIAELPIDAAEVLAGLGLDASNSDRGFLLIKRALFAAGYDLAKESLSHFQLLSSEATPKLSEDILTKISKVKISLNSEFLSNPNDLPILEEIIPIYEQWLVDMGTAPYSASLISRRFRSYFVYALSSEWRNNHGSYKELIEALKTPFNAAEERERDWDNYFSMIERRIDENVFDEPFGLAQIYVPLNAYYFEKSQSSAEKNSTFSQEKKRRVVSLEDELTEWISRRQKEDAVRVVSGGPGSGKSSFMKMLCAKICRQRLAKPLYIPLHLIDPTRDVADEISKFVREEGFLRFNPLDTDFPIKDLIIVFDGLDELASQGKIAAQVAKDFVQAVERMVERRNLGSNSLLVLISGRELVVQENSTEFRRHKQILNVLPYFVPQEERNVYIDPEKLLNDDLRSIWWRKYGILTNQAFDNIPIDLQKHEIDEITAQPLLNFLVALSYSRGKLNFSESLNLNNVYADLVTAVYERGYEKNRIHRSISHIQQKDFLRVLEEIGLAAWHGSDGRSTSVNEILTHCKESGLESLITTFQEGAKAGVTKLLAAFFFRQNGQQITGDATFVFTHKSFGEYLTAIRIVRGIERIVIQLQRKIENPDDGYDITEGLVHWTKLVGRAQMTTYIRKFLLREIRQKDQQSLKQWKDRLSDLLSQAVEKQMPMEKIGVLSFSESCRQNNNASESLVIAVNACAVVLKDKITLKFKTRSSFGSFIRKLAPQRTGPKSPILYDALSYFDFSEQSFDLADLYGANLSYTKWTKSSMHYANLATANLRGAIFDQALMIEVDLNHARLSESSLIETKITGAKLLSASFKGAILVRSDISYSDVENADFTDADITGMMAQGVDFSRCHIKLSDLAKLDTASRDSVLGDDRRPPSRKRLPQPKKVIENDV